MRPQHFAASILALGSTLGFSAAYAQFQWNPPIGVWPGVMHFNNQVNNTLLPRPTPSNASTPSRGDRARGVDSNASSRPQPTRNIPTTYAPSTARTRANLANFVAKTRRTDPDQADKMQELFASVDVIAEIDKVMRQFGLTKNNAAHAYALYWISSWQAANGDASTPSVQMTQAVAAQAILGLSQSTEFAAANDANKQEFAEALLIQTALIDAQMQAADGDPIQLRAVANAVKQGASAIGIELDTMTLTEQGFKIELNR